MSAPNDVTIPIEWTFFYYAAIVILLVAVAAGIVWSLRHSATASTGSRTVWVVIQLALPLIGFALWLIVESRPSTPATTDVSPKS